MLQDDPIVIIEKVEKFIVVKVLAN